MVLIHSWNRWQWDSRIEPVATAEPTNTDVSPEGNFYTEGSR